jgi:hypothetical protein
MILILPVRFDIAAATKQRNSPSTHIPNSLSTSNVGTKRAYTAEKMDGAETRLQQPINKKLKIDRRGDIGEAYIGWLSAEPLIKVFAKLKSNGSIFIRAMNVDEAEELPLQVHARWSVLVPTNTNINIDKITLDKDLFPSQGEEMEGASKIKLIKNLLESMNSGTIADPIKKSHTSNTRVPSKGKVKKEEPFGTENKATAATRWTFEENSLLSTFTNNQIELEMNDISHVFSWTKHWENVSAKLQRLGYNRSAGACMARVSIKIVSISGCTILIRRSGITSTNIRHPIPFNHEAELKWSNNRAPLS